MSNIGRPEIAAIGDWLIDGARSAAAPQQVLAVLCERLVAAGVPLWREQGRRGEARDLLAPVYAWFTEGFNTADLKDAKRLLDELT